MDESVIIECAVELVPGIGRNLHVAVVHDRIAGGRPLSQIKVLTHLYRCGCCTVSDVATALGVSLPTASGLIDRLVDDGLIERQVNRADRRQVLVGLTAEAQEFAARIHDLRRRQMRAALDRLDPAERPIFLRSLHALSEALRLEPDELPKHHDITVGQEVGDPSP